MKDALHIEKLQRTHEIDTFDCGQPELNRFLIRHALQAQQANSAQTYVGLSGNAPSQHYFFEAIFECSEVQNAPFLV